MRRYWYQGTDYPKDEFGFVIDPTSSMGCYAGKELKTLEDLVNEDVLILLGAPGMGKTTELRDFAKQLRGQRSSDTAIIFEQLGDFGDEVKLLRFVREQAGESPNCTLLLDALDEWSGHPAELWRGLYSFRNKFHGSFRLWISCRSSEWGRFQDGFKRIWQSQADVWHLAPLSPSAVEEILQSHDPTDQKPTRGEFDRQLAGLLQVPLTLNLLTTAGYPLLRGSVERWIIYEKGLLALCNWSVPQDDWPHTPEVLDAASSLAVFMLLSDRRRFGGSANSLDPDPEMLGSLELLDALTTSAIGVPSAANYLRVTKTGLFTSPSSSSFVWSHHSYLEFLCARFLKRLIERQDGVPPGRVFNLISTITAGKRSVAPRLRGMAGWLASGSPTFRSYLLEHDHRTLLRSDSRTLAPDQQRALLTRLLTGYNEDHAVPFEDNEGWEVFTAPELAETLSNWLENTENFSHSRRAAIRIAEQVGTPELARVLARLALDDLQDQDIREDAVWSVCRMSCDDVKASLKPIIRAAPGRVSAAMVEGALRCLWPNHISAGELFRALSTHADYETHDGFHRFIYRVEIASQLQDKDLPEAIAWIPSTQVRYALPDAFESLIAGILDRAVLAQSDPTVIASLARCCVDLSAGGSVCLDRTLTEALRMLNAESRCRFIATAMPRLALMPNPTVFGVRPILCLVSCGDLEWLCDQYRRCSPDSQKGVWLQLLDYAVTTSDRELPESLFTLAETDEAAGGKLGRHFGAVDLRSSEANNARAEFERWQAIQSPPEPLEERDPLVLLDNWLERVDLSPTERWPALSHILTQERDGSTVGVESWGDISAGSAWRMAGEERQRHLIEEARAYVFQTNVPDLPTDRRLPWFVMAAFPALMLLKDQLGGPEWDELLRRWGACWLIFPAHSDPQSSVIETQQKVAVELYRRGAAAFLGMLDRFLAGPKSARDCCEILRWLSPNESDTEESTLLRWITSKVEDPEIEPAEREAFLRELIRRHRSSGVRWIKSMVSGHEGIEAPAGFTLRACALWLEEDPDEAWARIINLTRDHVESGRRLIELFLTGPDIWRADSQVGVFLSRSSEITVGNVYAAVVEWFPPNEDPKLTGVYAVSPRHEVVDFRRVLLDELGRRASPVAVQELRSLRARFPQLLEISYRVLEAGERARMAASPPISPSDLSEWLQRPHVRIIRSDEELLEAILDCLDELQRLLLAETPAVRDLWDRQKNDTWEHVKEEEFSDYVKRFLDRELLRYGVRAHREVKISQGMGPSRPGSRTDIYVTWTDTKPNGNRDPHTVLIEVKGDWNPKLKSALKDQLVQQYLVGHGLGCGLYLIGWFGNPESADPEADENDPLAARTRYAQQARQCGATTPEVRVASYVLDCRLGPVKRAEPKHSPEETRAPATGDAMPGSEPAPTWP